MKVTFSFLIISASILISQQNPQFRNFLPPWAWIPQQPRMPNIYDYLYARSIVEAAQSAQQIPDVQSRNNSPDNEDNFNGRFFFNYVTTAGGTSSYFNPLLKTIYYISSSTATTTLVSTCIPAASFDNTLYTVACRKRREIMELLLGENAPEVMNEFVSPSQVLPVEASKDFAAIAPRSLIGDDAILVPVEIASSKTEDYLVENGFFSEMEKAREKRFLIASTTITTYIFTTTISTKTLSNLGSELSCLPTQFALC